jgi:hypothetical protein
MHGFLKQVESVHPLGERGMDGERRPGIMKDREGQQTVLSATPPSTNFMLVGSIPIEPEQYTIPLHLIAWEKKGIGAGALVVRTDSLSVMASDLFG